MIAFETLEPLAREGGGDSTALAGAPHARWGDGSSSGFTSGAKTPPKFQIGQSVKMWMEDSCFPEKSFFHYGKVKGIIVTPEKKWEYVVKWSDEGEKDYIDELYCWEEEKLMGIDGLEARVKRHYALLKAIASGAVTVTLHDCRENLGFPYLEVVAALPERLNKPRPELIGQSCLSVDPRIGEPRFYAIKKALANGQCETYHYTYDDDFHWEFKVSVAPLYGSEEIITIVSDAADWQLGHWLNKK